MGFLSCWNSAGVLRKDQSCGDVCSPSPGLGAAGGCAHSQPLLEGSGLCTPRRAPSAGTGSPEDTPSLPQVKCYHKKYRSATRDVIFRLQFHTGAVQGYGLVFAKEDLDNASKGEVPAPSPDCGCGEWTLGGRPPAASCVSFTVLPRSTRKSTY